MTERKLSRRAQAYAETRRRFLRESFPETYARLEKARRLDKHCRTIGLQAEDMYMSIVHDMQGPLLNNRKMPYMQRLAALEAIPQQASEMVNSDLIFNPPGGAR
jgi:hypothetical protein